MIIFGVTVSIGRTIICRYSNYEYKLYNSVTYLLRIQRPKLPAGASLQYIINITNYKSNKRTKKH